MRRLTTIGSLVIATLVLIAGIGRPSTQVTASSHREAPVISFDPAADNTDTYVFTSPDKPDTVTIVGDWIPFQNPFAGPYYYRFGDDVRYTLHIDNNGSGTDPIRFDFDFRTTVRNGNELLYNTGPITGIINDPNLNVFQTYTITRTDASGSTVLAQNLPVAPYNVGGLSYPQGYDLVANQAIKQIGNGISVFAGPRADPFFVDVGAVFDLLNIRKPPGNMGGGVNALAGLNIHTIALQMPKSMLTASGQNPTDPADPAAILGVWATAARQSMPVLAGTGQSQGPYIQVSRLGNPLFNEAVIPYGFKDRFNASTPQQSIAFDAQFGGDPEIAILLNKIYGIKIPPQPSTNGPARDDLAAIFLTGIKGATMPQNVTPAEEERINLAVPLTANPNRLGVLGGDNQGFPNGRRLADDVVDIELQALAGAVYPLFHKDFTPDPLAPQLGDGVDGPDKPFLTTFPYVASPYSGDTGPFRGRPTP
ncbi:MAG: DUF4331 domain-containing protein [Dehalococcoidia bacterium]